MGNKTFDFSSKKKGFFAPKRPNLAQNWHFWLIWARPCRFFRCPVGGSVGGCGARAVSRKTPIYFMVDQPVDAVLQAVLSLSIQTVAGLPQGLDAGLVINVLEISGRQTVASA